MEFSNPSQIPDSTLNNSNHLEPVTLIQESHESFTDCVISIDGTLETDLNILSDPILVLEEY